MRALTLVALALGIQGCLDGGNVVVPRMAPAGSAASCDPSAGPTSTVNVRATKSPARGDGVTDDTDALQYAIDLAVATPAAGEPRVSIVYFPAGEYRITAPLRIERRREHEHVTLLGAGPEVSVIHNHDRNGQPALVVKGVRGRSENSFAVRDLGIAGNAASGNGLELRRTIRQVDLDRVYLYDHGGDGLLVTDVSNRIKIDNCRIERHRERKHFRTSGAGIRLTTNAEQIWSYATSIRGFGTGIHIGPYANVVGIYGGDIHGNALGVLVAGSDRSDGRASSIELRGIYFEENGRDVIVTNQGNRFRAANVVIAASSFSKTTGRDGTYGRGAPLGDVAAVTLGRAESCSIESNEFRKISAPNVRWAIHLKPESRNNRIAQNFLPRSGMERSWPALIHDEGSGNWGNVRADDPLAFVYPGNLELAQGGVLRFGEHSLWIDENGNLRVLRGVPRELTSDGQILPGGRVGEDHHRDASP